MLYHDIEEYIQKYDIYLTLRIVKYKLYYDF